MTERVIAHEQDDLWTVAQFEAWAESPEKSDRLLELINGEIVEKMPSEEHGVMQVELSWWIKNWTVANNIKGFIGVEVRHRKADDPHNSRLPDVSFRYATTPLVEQGAVLQMPDFAAEIQSPDDAPHALREKAYYYLQNGTRLVWILFTRPKVKKVEVCTLTAKGTLAIHVVDQGGTLDGGDVLPGVTIPVSKLFPK